MQSKKVLIVDDEPDICELIEITLMRMGLGTQSAHNITDAKILLDSEKFDLCLTDMRLPDGNGIELVEHISANFSHIPVAVITAHGNMEAAVRALKAGAFDFVSKPVDIQILRRLATSATALASDETAKKEKMTSITGDSIAVKALLEHIGKMARSQAPVFIHGESGSGKERVARMIHEQGSRSESPFVPVNCGAIPAELMESEFFGHLKGSFTGASADKQGLFQAANGGTLFLDEVADLPLHMQVKLLRVIQEKAVKPVGAPHEESVDVRILSASHKNLVELVKAGQFREDLYYRINVLELKVPSLRDRVEDIPMLAKQVLQTLSQRAGLDTLPKLDSTAIRALLDYHYPGNVRELENILERALALADNHAIREQDLQLGSKLSEAEAKAPADETISSNSLVLENQEKQSIMQALEKTRWNKTQAARLLGLSLRQLRYRMEKFQIE
jgi:two-component system response regulator PilR (NtrC family)